jgi:hypothetical protein
MTTLRQVAELETIEKIALRAAALASQLDAHIGMSVRDYVRTVKMDVACVHFGGVPLRLDEMLEGPDEHFAHDVFGINRHLNRLTGTASCPGTPDCSRLRPDSHRGADWCRRTHRNRGDSTMATMNLKLAARCLEVLTAKGMAVMLTGAPGVGKSQLVHQVAGRTDRNVVDIRAARLDPVDVHGLPVPDLKSRTTVWLTPDMLPQADRDGDRGYLFLDELADAGKMMQSALYGLVLERRLGNYVLPEGWAIVAAGNRKSDRAAAQTMSTALRNRFAHLEVGVDVDTWVEHANRSNFAPVVVAFIRFRPNLLNVPPQGEENAFATPRSVERVCGLVDEPLDIRQHLVATQVGDGWAAEFEGFARIWASLPSVDDILAGKKAAVPSSSEPAVFFALSGALSRRSNRDNFGNVVAYSARMPKEFEVLTVTDAARRDEKLTKTRAFADWAAANGDVQL